MTKPGESTGYKASHFVRAIIECLGTSNPLDYLIFNSDPFPARLLQRYAADGQYPVELDLEGCQGVVRYIISRPVLGAGVYLRHDPHSLASTVMDIANDAVYELAKPVAERCQAAD